MTTINTADIRDKAVTSAKLTDNVTLNGYLAISTIGRLISGTSAAPGSLPYLGVVTSDGAAAQNFAVNKLVVSGSFDDLNNVPSPVGSAYFKGDVTVVGNLTVSGTTTQINTATLNVADNLVVLNNDVAGAPSEDAGIEIERGTSNNMLLQWNETNDYWEVSERQTSDSALINKSRVIDQAYGDGRYMAKGNTSYGNALQITTATDQIVELRQTTGGQNYIAFLSDAASAGTFVRKAYIGMTDDNTLALKAEGATTPIIKLDSNVSVTGNITMATNATVDGIDISTHAASATAHHTNVNDPDTNQHAALAGTTYTGTSTPSDTNRYVTNNDPRMSDSRTPTTHGDSLHNALSYFKTATDGTASKGATTSKGIIKFAVATGSAASVAVSNDSGSDALVTYTVANNYLTSVTGPTGGNGVITFNQGGTSTLTALTFDATHNHNAVYAQLDPGLTTTRYEETDGNIVYSGTWSTETLAGHSGGTGKYAQAAGAYAEFTFVGTGVRWLTVTYTNQGIATISVDGGTGTDIDLYSSGAAVYQKNMFEITGLQHKQHTIRVTAKGTKNASSTNTTVFVDAFEVIVNQSQYIYHDVSFNDNVTIYGNLNVMGSTTTISTASINLEDNIILLNSEATGAPAADSGIEIERGTSDNQLILWDETNDYWVTAARDVTNSGLKTYNRIVTKSFADDMTILKNNGKLIFEATTADTDNLSAIDFKENNSAVHMRMRHDGSLKGTSNGRIIFSAPSDSSDDILVIDRNKAIGINTDVPGATLEIVSPAVANTAETLFKASVGDYVNDYVSITNGTTGNASLLPIFRGHRESGSGTAFYIMAETVTAQDTGTNPVMYFDSKRSDGVIVTRPLFAWGSNTTTYMTMLADGKLGIGATTPAEKLEVNGNIRVTSTTGQVQFGSTSNYLTYDNTGSINSIYTPNNLKANAGSLYLGADAQLYRSTTDTLRTPDTLIVDTAMAIGLTSVTASRKLDVGGDIRLTGGLYSNNAYTGFYTDGNAAQPVKVGSLTVSSAYSDAAPTNGAYIKGIVGINVTSPGKQLEVGGDIRLTGSVYHPTASAYLGVLKDSGVSQQIKVGGLSVTDTYGDTTPSANNAYIKGSVGIGTTTTPGNKLAISGSSATGISAFIDNTNTAGYGALRINSGNADVGVGAALHQFGSTYAGVGAYTASTTALVGFDAGGLTLTALNAAGTIKFFTAGSAAANERMRIDATGKIGIGMTSPAYKLDVAADGIIARLKSATATSYCEVHIDNEAGNSLVMGSIGSTYSGVDWVGSTYIYNNGAGRMMYIKSQDRIDFFTAGTALANRRMSILSDGKVGIGTISPTKILDVNGDTNITGNLTLTGNLIAPYVKTTQGKAAQTFTFTKGTSTLTQTWTHNYGTTNYAIALSCNSPEPHIYWTAKTGNTISICIDDTPYSQDIIVDAILIGW